MSAYRRAICAVALLCAAGTVCAQGAQDMKDRMAALASEATTTSPARFADTVRDDFARWQKIIRETGARAE